MQLWAVCLLQKKITEQGHRVNTVILTSNLLVWSAAVVLQAGVGLSAGSGMVPYGAAQLMESLSDGLCSVLLGE